jgi:fibronectin type 3 domain-containing protein
MNDEGVLMEGDKVPEDRRMMEKGDTTEQEKIELEEEDLFHLVFYEIYKSNDDHLATFPLLFPT